MAHYLHYWAPPRAKLAFDSAVGPVLSLENGWFDHLSRGDTLWILSRTAESLVLVLRAKVASDPCQVRSHPEYAIRNSKVFRNWRVPFVKRGATGPFAVPVPMGVLRRLRFHGLSKKATGSLTKILDGPLGSLRNLDDRSIPVLDNIWQQRSGYSWTDVTMVKSAAISLDIQEPLPTVRRETTVSRIVRDTRQVRQIKQLHADRCQLCGTAIKLPGGVAYSEGHHLQPLGREHRGPDIAANILILCPNHHAQLDFAGRAIAKSDLRLHADHTVANRYVQYHNRLVRARAKLKRTQAA